MENRIPHATINGVRYDRSALLQLGRDKLADDDVADWEKKVWRFIADWSDERDSVGQLSSGTTGRPKELSLLKKAMVQSAQNTVEFLGLKSGDTALLCLPVDYIAGKMMVVRALVRGLDLLLVEPSGLPDLSRMDSVDFCALVPMQVHGLMQKGNGPFKIKKLIIGGAEIHRDLENDLQSVPVDVFATYGMAETCSHVAMRRMNGPNRQSRYTAMQGIRFSTDERDCLVIESAYLDKIVATNDIVDLIDENNFIWKGRFDNLINSGGVKVVPEEIEAIVTAKTGYVCAVSAKPDQKFGQKIVLVLESGINQIPLEEINEMIRKEVPSSWLPKEIVFVDTIPRNQSFKIDRFALLKQIIG